ncbi:hypothetical protein FKM82_030861 [Ascaphus truei]
MERSWILGLLPLFLVFRAAQFMDPTGASNTKENTINVSALDSGDNSSDDIDSPTYSLLKTSHSPQPLMASITQLTTREPEPSPSKSFSTQGADPNETSDPIHVKASALEINATDHAGLFTASDSNLDSTPQPDLFMTSTADPDDGLNTTAASHSTPSSTIKSGLHTALATSQANDTGLGLTSMATSASSRAGTMTLGLITANTDPETRTNPPKIDSGKNTEPPSPPTSQKPYPTTLVTLVVVVLIILILLIIIMVIFIARKKRRSGSQTFNTQSRKGRAQDVWAGQVPELAEGKARGEAEGVENGAAVPMSQGGAEPALTTFVGREKVDSVVEMEKMGGMGSRAVSEGEEDEGGDQDGEGGSVAPGEDRPLLEGSSEGTPEAEVVANEEQFPLPPVEQALLGDVDKNIL